MKSRSKAHLDKSNNAKEFALALNSDEMRIDNLKFLDKGISLQTSMNNTTLFTNKKRRQKSSPTFQTFLDYKNIQGREINIGDENTMFHFPPIIENIAKVKSKNEKSFYTFQEIERKGKDIISTMYPNDLHNLLAPTNILKEIADPPNENNSKSKDAAKDSGKNVEINIIDATYKSNKMDENSISPENSHFINLSHAQEKKLNIVESHLKFNRGQVSLLSFIYLNNFIFFRPEN